MGSQAVKAPKRGTELRQFEPTVRHNNNSKPSKVLLVATFGVTFAFACVAVMFAGSLLQRSSSEAAIGVVEGRHDEKLFPESLDVRAAGHVVRVAHDPGLNPSTDGAFLLTVWFKLKKPLLEGDRVPLLGKFNPSSLSKPGYSIAFAAGPDGIRPQVYWQDETGKGKWLTFATTQIVPKEWYLLALSFRDSRYLGMHIRQFGESGKGEVLGGYDLEGAVVPNPVSSLLVGAFGTSKFRGRVGPIAVFKGEDLPADVSKLLKTMVATPHEIPHQIKSDDVVLWASPRIDSGPKKIEIVSPGDPRPSK